MELTPPPEEEHDLLWFFDLNMTDVTGEMAERWLFDELQDALDDSIDETVVLHTSHIVYEDSLPKEQEFDFFLFVPSRKLVMCVEVKRTFNENTSTQQLQKYKQIIEESLSDQLGDGWTYFPVFCVYQPTNEMINFTTSNNYFIHSETNIKEWFSSAVKSFPIHLDYAASIQQLRNVLKILVFVMQMSKPLTVNPSSSLKPGIVVESKWQQFVQEALNTICTKSNILFYSNNQLPIFLNNSPEYQKVYLNGCYGAGKTFLMKEKIAQLAAQNETCWYINMRSRGKSNLLMEQLKEEWKDFTTIKIVNTIDGMVSFF